MAPRLTSSPFERADISFSRLLLGEPGQAGQALMDPSALSPAERVTLADQWGVGGSSWYRTILRTVTNPLVLIGMVLAVKHPIPLAKDLFKFAPALKGLARKPGVVGRWLGGIDETFAGLKAGKTTLPEAYKGLMRDMLQFTEKYSDEVAGHITRYEGAGGIWNRETGILLAAKLEGKDVGPKAIFRSIQKGPAFDRLVSDVRQTYQDVYSQVFDSLNQRSIRMSLRQHNMPMSEFSKLLKQAGDPNVDAKLDPIFRTQERLKAQSYRILNTAGIDTQIFENANRLNNYFPHRSIRSLAEYERQTAALVDVSLDEASLGQRAMATAGRTVHGKLRRMRMLPDPDDLKHVESWLLDPNIIQKYSQKLQESPGLRTYSYNFVDTTKAYLNSVGRAYAWVAKRHGKDITDALRRLEASPLPHNRVRASMLKNTYIPVALGRLNMKQLEASAHWDSLKLSLLDNLKTGQLGKLLPTGIKNYLEEGLVRDEGIFNLRNIQGRLTAHLTVGALGMNPVTSAWNMMQTLLTTVPVIGAKATYQGMKSVISKVPRYFSLRASGVAHDEALAKVFPAFSQAALEASPLAMETLSELDRAWTSGLRMASSVKRPYDQVRHAMMAMFRTSENFVRLTAFEGTMAKALKEGMSMQGASTVARRVTEATQFLAGPAQRPYMFVGRSPLLSQFGSFGARYLNFLTSTATELGSGAQSGLWGLLPNRNLGTLGRAMAVSGATYEAGQEMFGQDLTRGLMFGALPTRPEGSFLSPIPFMPPALSLALAATQGVTTGDFGPLTSQLPILVPGGVQMARMTTAYAPGVAQALGRQYADYNRVLPDGRIPIYDKDKTLRAYMTPMQLHMSTLGLPPSGPEGPRQEAELSRYLLSQRDRILNFKRDYYEALLSNNSREAERVHSAYQEAYPELGPLRVSKAEMQAVQTRMMIPRLERVLNTLPADARPEFGKLIQTVLAQQGESLLGVDPSFFTQPGSTIRSRNVHRVQPPANVLEELSRLRLGSAGTVPMSNLSAFPGVAPLAASMSSSPGSTQGSSLDLGIPGL